MIQTKRCCSCKTEKPATPEHFGLDRARDDGLYPACRPCRRAGDREAKARWVFPTLPDDYQKVCKHCGEAKPAASFYKKEWTRDGLNPLCDDCRGRALKKYASKKIARAEKVCPTCNHLLPADRFMSDAAARDLIAWQCRDCANAARRDKTVKKISEWIKPCQKCGATIGKKYGVWSQKFCAPCGTAARKASAKNGAAAYLERKGDVGRKEMRRLIGQRRRQNPKYRLHDAMTSRVYRVLKGRKRGPMHDLLPYTHDELIAHIERQLQPGMSWENYGRGGWHVGHRRPVAWFNFDGPEHPDFALCWALSNLFPQWESENLSAGPRKSFELA